MAERWSIEGTILDACDCTTLCPCNYGQDATNDTCTPMLAYHIEHGAYGSTKLDGLTAIGILHSVGKNLLAQGAASAAWLVDERANPQQRTALESILGGKAGGLFGMLATMIKKSEGVTYVPIAYKNDEKSWSVKAGNVLEVTGGFVKAPPGLPFPSVPKRVQTYDPFFSPTMEKTVGVAEKFFANVGSMRSDVRGRYSSAGKFKLAGPE